MSKWITEQHLGEIVKSQNLLRDTKGSVIMENQDCLRPEGILYIEEEAAIFGSIIKINPISKNVTNHFQSVYYICLAAVKHILV